MPDESTVIDTPIPTEQWNKMVQFYTRLLGPPQQPSDSEAHFPSPDDGLVLRLVREDTEQELSLTRAPKFSFRGGPKGRKEAKDTYDKVISEYGNDCAPIIEFGDAEDGIRKCTIGVVWVNIRKGPRLESYAECVIHNPNWPP